MANQDYYATLGVAKDASTDDIKKAYRKLAHKYHPDKGKGDDAKFKEVNEAYQVLSDPAKRQQYDQFGAAGGPNGPGSAGFDPNQGFGGFQGQGFDFGNMGGFGDIFEQFFSGGQTTRTRGPARGADLEVQLNLSFEEAVKGATKPVNVTRRVRCATCKGSGAEPNTKIIQCPRCSGSGEIRTQRQTILGVMQQVTTCPQCHGSGKVPEQPCHTCGGEGRVQQSQTLDITIPAGIDDGQTIRINDQGEAGERGAPNGHLYVTVRVAASRQFTRDGADLHLQVPISYPQAVLGDELEVPTLDGSAKLSVPAGTPSGKTFRLKGAGVSKLGSSSRGDLLVTVEINVPKKLSAEEREAINQLAQASGHRPTGKKGFFDKLGL